MVLIWKPGEWPGVPEVVHYHTDINGYLLFYVREIWTWLGIVAYINPSTWKAETGRLL